jgi:hypothetical protein
MYYNPYIFPFSVNTTNPTNGALSNLIINGTTPLAILSGDYLQMDFPPEVGLLDNVTCSTGNKVLTITCKKVSNVTLRLTFINTTGGQVMPAKANFSYTIVGIRNPPNTRWTQSFTNISLYDSQGSSLA